MWDGMSWSNSISRFFDKLFFVSKVISIILITIIVSVIVIKYLIKKADKNNPSGNTKRRLKHTIIAILVGIIIWVITHLLPIDIYISLPFLWSIPDIAINLIACIYGPVAGFLVGFWGNIIGELAEDGYSVWFWLKENYFFIPTGLYGLIIGFFWKKITSCNNNINIKNIIIFCLFQITCNFALSFIYCIPYIDQFVDNVLKPYYICYIIGTILTGVVLFIYKYNIDIRRSTHNDG
jgi:uncharacterized membrane protein